MQLCRESKASETIDIRRHKLHETWGLVPQNVLPESEEGSSVNRLAYFAI